MTRCSVSPAVVPASPPLRTAHGSRAAGIAALVLLFIVTVLTSAGRASEVTLTGAEGHPRERFPLPLHLATSGEATLDTAARRAVTDWNTLTRDALGVTAFVEVTDRATAQVRVTFEPPAGRLMGLARMAVGPGGMIELPVRIEIFPAVPRGETPANVLLYQLLAHELGHALGLPHTTDPRSIMCCIAGSIDFTDATIRDAYVEARRHPDLETARVQLTEQYARVWGATSGSAPRP